MGRRNSTPPPPRNMGHSQTLSPCHFESRVARVPETMVGGDGRKSNPPSAASASIYLLNHSVDSSRWPSQISKQKTRRNGFASYIPRTNLDRACWGKQESPMKPSSRTITTSENTGDVVVDNSVLRKFIMVGPRTLIFSAVISRDRSDLLFDRLKFHSKVPRIPVGW